ncbi:hypothetical protein [Streptomyces sp. OE57]|uniref:hypothetical protein n=1 Tax=Streptomyces lacaronensis TaxID=3379885 RepID=UPI0039B765E7
MTVEATSRPYDASRTSADCQPGGQQRQCQQPELTGDQPPAVDQVAERYQRQQDSRIAELSHGDDHTEQPRAEREPLTEGHQQGLGEGEEQCFTPGEDHSRLLDRRTGRPLRPLRIQAADGRPVEPEDTVVERVREMETVEKETSAETGRDH